MYLSKKLEAVILLILTILLTCIYIQKAKAQPIGEWDPFSIHLDGTSTTTAVIPMILGFNTHATGGDGMNALGTITGIGPGFGIETGNDQGRLITTFSHTQNADHGITSQIVTDWAGSSSSTRQYIGQKILLNAATGAAALSDATGAFVGQDIYIKKNNVDDIASIAGMRIGGGNNTQSSGDVSNWWGIKINSPSLTGSAGAVTNLFGIDIDPQNSGASTASYKIGMRIQAASGGSGAAGLALTGDGNTLYWNTFNPASTYIRQRYSLATNTLFFEGSSGADFQFSGPVVITGQTTLDTALTGLLEATAGVVGTATAGTDYVRTFSATYPIVNTGTAADPTIQLDQGASFTWSGQHEWISGGSILLDEDIPLYIGNNLSALGDVKLWFNSGTGQVTFADDNGYIASGNKIGFEPALIVNQTLDQFSLFGVVPQLVTPSDNNDTIVVGRSFDGNIAGGKRAGLFESYYTGSTNHSGFNAGLNAFASTTSGSSGNLTATTQSGGLSGGRYRTAHGGTGLVSLSTGISILTTWTNTGNTTNAIALQIEVPTKSSTGAPVTWYGIKLPDMSGAGIATGSTYGIFIPPIKSNYPVWFDVGAEAFFREAGNRIYSSAAATLDFEATTTINLNAGAAAAPQLKIASSTVTVANAVNFVFNTSTGTKFGTGTTQKIGFYNATAIVQPTATTDLGTVLSNLGLRAAGTAYPITTSGNILFNGGTFQISKAVPAITLTDSGGDDYVIDVGSSAGLLRIRNTTDSSNGLQIDGSGNVAVSTSYSPSTAAKFYVQDRTTNPALSARAAFSATMEMIVTSANWSGGNMRGFLGGTYWDGSTVDFNNSTVQVGLEGGCTLANMAAARIVSSTVGLFGTNQISGTGGTVTSAANISGYGTVSGGVVVTNFYGFDTGSISASGGSTITTLTGYRVRKQTGGTTNYDMMFDTDAKANFRDGNQYMYSSAASTLDDSANTTRNFRIGGTVELALTATQLDLMSANTDRVNFIGGSDGGAPSTTLTPTFTSYYGGNTNALGDPVGWINVKVNGVARKIPYY